MKCFLKRKYFEDERIVLDPNGADFDFKIFYFHKQLYQPLSVFIINVITVLYIYNMSL